MDGLLLWAGKLIETVVFFSTCVVVLDFVGVGEVVGDRTWLLEGWLDGVKLMTLGGDPLRR